MRKLSLFKKTWLIIMTSIILTVVILGSAVSFFAKDLIYDVQQTRFESLVDEIMHSFEKEESASVLEKYQSMDLTMIVGEGDELFIPTDFLDGAELDEMLISSDGGNKTSTIYGSNAKDFFVTFRRAPLDGVESSVVIRYPVVLGSNEMGVIVLKILPYFLLITLLVTSVIALVYARYFSKRIERVSDVVDAMALGTYTPKPYECEGDEIDELEGEINQMYDRLQMTLINLSDKVETVNRLEEDRKLFMRGTIHELKTPIMNMSLEVERLLSESSNLNEAFLLRMNQRLSSMSKLIKELLEISSHEEITDLTSLNLNDVLEEVITSYDYLLNDKGNKLSVVSSGTLRVKIPHKSLIKMISNLLGNAIKYSLEDSVIEIDISGDRFTISNTFTNSGQLDKMELEEPFISISDNDDLESNGLGLYLVKSLAQYYGLSGQYFLSNNRFTYILSVTNS